MEKVLFNEEQRFTQSWLWILILASFGIPIIILVNQLIVSVSENSKEVMLLSFILSFITVIGAVMVWLFIKMRLIVEISMNEIRFKFPPLLYKWKRIDKNEIERFEVRRYKPITEYGGWGIKTNWRGRNTAYNVSGNIGLQLYLKNGKKLLIGTQKKQAIEYAMEKLMDGETKLMHAEKKLQVVKSVFGRKTKKIIIILAIEIIAAILIFTVIQIFK